MINIILKGQFGGPGGFNGGFSGQQSNSAYVLKQLNFYSILTINNTNNDN